MVKRLDFLRGEGGSWLGKENGRGGKSSILNLSGFPQLGGIGNLTRTLSF